ncbi:MAG TPA: hypothetical protein VG056_00670 [Pirellulales bacterium]|jgi:hypothetical protein|nr:hypothetical protein [Pirellulales bacterium]
MDDVEFLDEPPPVQQHPQPPHSYNSFQYLLGAAAGCIVGGAAAMALFVCLMQGGLLTSDTLQSVTVVMGIAPIIGAGIALWLMAARKKR